MALIPVYQYPKQKSAVLKRCFPSNKTQREVEDSVADILSDVRQKGDGALAHYTQKFDGVSIKGKSLKIPAETIKASLHPHYLKKHGVGKAFTKAVGVAMANIKAFHKRQLQSDVFFTGKHGERLTLRQRPIHRAGIYIPGGSGGSTPLVSSLLMNAIPAQIAGVKEIFCASPPLSAEGALTLNPHLMFALAKLGIHEVYGVGGAQAIAAMAYGSKKIPKADIVSGPGNAYVNEAKRRVLGEVMIDGLYGNSEIVIISEGKAKASHVAADMLSQCEHAGGELALLITPSKSHAEEVLTEITNMLEILPRKNIILSSLKTRGCIALVELMEEAVELANAIAPEHLEILARNPQIIAKKIEHAGAIFLGEYASEPIGDYIAGTNHVLPTNRAARFSSPLGVQTFMRQQNIIAYNSRAFQSYAPHAAVLAQCENLHAHENALKIRMKKPTK